MNEDPEKPIQEQPKRNHHKKLLLIIAIALLIAGGIMAGLIYMYQKNSTPLSEYAARVNFPLYYPAKAKTFFQFNPQSVTSQVGLFTYTGNYRARSMVIVEQPMPDQFDYNIVSAAKEITVKIGKIYIAELGNRPTGIIITGKTLVTISSPAADAGLIEQFTQEF
jgi:hypothetical protein